MLQVETRRLIEAAEESIKHGASDVFEDDLGLAATKDVFGSVTGQLSPLTGNFGGGGASTPPTLGMPSSRISKTPTRR